LYWMNMKIFKIVTPEKKSEDTNEDKD
jgi:hypothetical protein